MAYLVRSTPCMTFTSLEEARQIIGTFIERYDDGWILERHGYKTPSQARKHLTRKAA